MDNTYFKMILVAVVDEDFLDCGEIPNKQTDIEKLDSHEFDRKKSFRHRK